MSNKPSQYALGWYWLRSSSHVLLAAWVLGFLVIPIISSQLNPGADDAKSIGLGASFGFVMIVVAWLAVAIQVGLWLGLVDYAPKLDLRYEWMLLYSVILFLLVFRETVIHMPTLIFGGLLVLGFTLPRMIRSKLKRGVFCGYGITASDASSSD